MPEAYRDELVFIPLGGVGEIGMNMAAYGFGPPTSRKWIVVDCGVTFAGPTQPGIELIMADPSFLEDNADDVLALILTHSHEDHYGAVLDLWPAFDRPVYATAITAAMLSAKRAADNIVDDLAVRPMVVGKPFTLGPITIEAVNVAISTPAGRVFHTVDWMLVPHPIGARPTDEARFRALAAEGFPIALVCDSTNALKDGESPSADEVAAPLAALLAAAPHRVALTTFASNVGRHISV